MEPDWVGVAVHYPDGRTILMQIDRPNGSIDVEAETYDATVGMVHDYRNVLPTGRKFARIEFEGQVGDMQSTRGPRPKWPTAPAGEITEAQRAIEGS